MADYGYSNAFNVRTGASEAANNHIQDLKFGEELRKQNEAMAMAKQKMFLDDLDFQNGSNPYDDAIIKKEGQKLVQELGELYKDPRAYYDPAYGAQIKFKKQSIKSTPGALRSVAYKDAVGQYVKYMQEAKNNPSKYNLDQLDAFKAKMDNYGKDEMGRELPSDQVKPLIFDPPEELSDVDKLEKETGTSLEPQTYESLKNGRDGASIGYLSDKDALEQAAGIYKNNASTYNYKNKGAAPEEIVQGIAQRLKNYVPIKYDIGDRNPVTDALAIAAGKARIDAIANAKAAGHQVDPYALLLNDRYTKDDPKVLAATFGSNVPYSYTDSKGNLVKAQGEDFNYEGTIFDKGYKKDGKYDRTGIKVTPGYVEKTMDWAKDEGFLTKPFFGDPEVKPEFQDRVKIVSGPIDKDGKAAKIVQLNAFNEVPANDAKWALKYNKQFTTTKQRDGLGINESMLEAGQSLPEIGMVKGGYKYTGGDPASQNSWKKI